jgi:hypothetical protein
MILMEECLFCDSILTSAYEDTICFNCEQSIEIEGLDRQEEIRKFLED